MEVWNYILTQMYCKSFSLVRLILMPQTGYIPLSQTLPIRQQEILFAGFLVYSIPSVELCSSREVVKTTEMNRMGDIISLSSV